MRTGRIIELSVYITGFLYTLVVSAEYTFEDSALYFMTWPRVIIWLCFIIGLITDEIKEYRGTNTK